MTPRDRTDVDDLSIVHRRLSRIIHNRVRHAALMQSSKRPELDDLMTAADLIAAAVETISGQRLIRVADPEPT